MMRRLLREESGMTMALVVILIVLIGVMGAGLLTFVTRDLEGVAEAGRGQRASEAADAGIEAARSHLKSDDALPASYDEADTSDNSEEWYYDETDTGDTRKTITLGNGVNASTVEVDIRYLRPSSTEDEARQDGQAPEVLPEYEDDTCQDTDGDGEDDDFSAATEDVDACEYPDNANYFEVTARGEAGGAVRQVQAIFLTRNFDLPVAYYATRDIDFNGASTSVNGISLFANRYITDLRPERITGQDQAYGNWAEDPVTGEANPYNSVPRQDTSGSSSSEAARAAGAAALGIEADSPQCPVPNDTNESGITYSDNNTNRKQKAGTDSPRRYGYRDYDRDSDYRCDNSSTSSSGRPDFLPAASGEDITFPFATQYSEGAEEARTADDELLQELKAKAQSQGLYTRVDPGGSFTIDDTGGDTPDYPASSDLTETVMFIEFANADGTSATKGEVLYKANSSDSDNLVKGTIVVVNGDLETSPSADDFQGVMVIRDSDDTDNDENEEENVMEFDNSGSLNIEGYVNVEGDMSLGGSVDGFLPAELRNGVPGLFNITQWSWRECYTDDCV